VTIVTVFRSRLRPGVEDAYGEVADEMSRLVRAMDGFVDEKFYTSPDEERVTIVRFRDRESQRAWAELPQHVAAQRRGRDEFYTWYDISVSVESYQRTFGDPESELPSLRQ
jgi:heme-degrading monooxygenase HmoA